MRLLVVLVVTVALLLAATPIALSQSPWLHSPLFAVAAFGIAVIALVAGAALLVRATTLHRRAALAGDGSGSALPRRGAVAARVVPSPRRGPGGQPPADESVTDPRAPRSGTNDSFVRVDATNESFVPVLVPTAGRVTLSTSASATGPRHAPGGSAPRQPRHDPSMAGQSPTGPSHTQAQQSSPTAVFDDPDDDSDAAVAEAAAARSAAFADRYTTTRSRR